MLENEPIGSDRAWEIYCNREIISPGYAAELAHRRRLCREWATAGAPLR
jgi:hypothetical protein